MENSNIGWTNHTANMWWGCTRVHAGCDLCYASEVAQFRGHNVWGNQNPRRMIKNVWNKLKEFQRNAEELNEIHRVFVGSMMDIFEPSKPLVDGQGNPLTEGTDEYWNTGQLRDRFFKEVVPNSPNLMFLLLTKRPSIINNLIPVEWHENPPPNIMFGTSVSDQETANTLIPHLANVNGKRFLSAEPLLGQIDLSVLDGNGNTLINSLDWIIVGGESGKDEEVRPMDSGWVSLIKDQCESNNIALFFKQWGSDQYNPNRTKDPTIKKNHVLHTKGGCMYNEKIYMNYPSYFNVNTTNIVNLFNKDYFVVDQWKGLCLIDEFKSYLPPVNEDTYLEMKANIKKNKIDSQILFIEDAQKNKIVVDGHNRLRAARELGLTEIPARKVDEKFENLEEIKLYILKNQSERRNLTTVDKLKIAFLSVNEIERKANKNLSDAGKNKTVDKKINTCEEIAKIAGVSASTVSRYKYVIDHSKEFDEISKTIINSLNNGEITVSKAQSLMKKHAKKSTEIPGFTSAAASETLSETISENSLDISSETSTETAIENTFDYTAMADIGIPPEPVSHSRVASHAISDSNLNTVSKSSTQSKSMNKDQIIIENGSYIEATDSLKKGEIEAVIILNNKNHHELITKYMKVGSVKIVFMN